MLNFNLKSKYLYNLSKWLSIEYSTNSDIISDMRKKLRDLHKLDSVKKIKNIKEEPDLSYKVNMDMLNDEDYIQNDKLNNASNEIPDPNHKKFLKSLSAKDEDNENVILTNYGVIRTDNINKIKNISTKSTLNTESINSNEENIKNQSDDLDVQYFADLITKAPDLLKNRSTGFKLSELDEDYLNSKVHLENKDTQIQVHSGEYADPAEKFDSTNLFEDYYFGETITQSDDFVDNINITLKDNVLGKDFINNEIYAMNNDMIDITNDQTPAMDAGDNFKENNYNKFDEAFDKENIFDVEYFPNVQENIKTDLSNKTKIKESNRNKYHNSILIDNQLKSKNMESKESNNEIINKKLSISPKENSKRDILNINQESNKKVKSHNSNNKLSSEFNSSNTIIHESLTRREIKNREKCFVNLEEPKTAYDLVMKMRKDKLLSKHDSDNNNIEKNLNSVKNIGKWNGRLDNKGFRLLKDQALDLTTLPKDDVVSILKDNILYEDDKIVILDKPYGLPSHGGPGIVHSVGQLLADLTLRIDKRAEQPLHLVHRLDKDTTGIIILARSPQSADILRSMFNEKQIIKKYWAITKGVPEPTEGIIDIPMGEGNVANRYRMELRPNYPTVMRLLHNINKDNSAKRISAVTKYRVISHQEDAALVECQLDTGTKHQIRCHLAFALNTPILGDHKYSHYNKFAPQKLPGSMLQRLGIRQETVRYIPMHLHAHSVVLQQFKEGKNLFIMAKPPKFFMQNLKWLKLVTK